MENLLNHKAQNKIMQKALIQSIRGIFPLTNGGRVLRLNNITITDTLDDMDFHNQKEVKLSRKSWQLPILADFELTDEKTGAVLDRAKGVKIGNVPKITNRFSTIIDGNEYQTINQLRRKSGIYSRIKKNGELESEFNLSKGQNFKMQLDPTSELFVISFANRKYRLWTLLNTLGVSDAEIKKQWGPELLEYNKKGALNTEASEMTSIYKRVYKKDPKNYDEVIHGLREYFKTTEVDPDTTKITLGKSFNTVNGDALLAASGKLLSINRGAIPPDDRDSLIFKRLYSVDDLMLNYFDKQAPVIQKKLVRTIGLKDRVRDIISAATFGEPIKKFFTVGDMSSTPPQTNPVTIIDAWRKTTPMGAGGIGSMHAITMDTRDIQPTHLGFLDPLNTPECSRPDYQVFTFSGWKRFDEITIDDFIACNINGKLEFHKPKQVKTFDYKGYMYGFKNKKIDLLVTQNHRLWSRPLDKRSNLDYKIEIASEVFGKDRLMKLNHFAYDNTKSEQLYKNLNMVDWASFIGWFISNGTRAGLNKSYVQLSQSSKVNKENVKKIKILLNKLGFKWYYSRNHNFNIKEPWLVEELKPLGHCDEKYIPEYLFNTSLEARTALLTALIAGNDRRTDPKNPLKAKHMKQETYTTTSKHLANDLQRLMISLGLPTSIKRYQDKKEDRYLDVYEVRILEKGDTQVLASKGHQYKEWYEGPVVGITVPGGLIYTKNENSSPVWTGNSLKVGVSVGLASEVKKVGNDMATPIVDKENKIHWVSPTVFFGYKIGFPDQYKVVNDKIIPKGDLVKVMYKGITTEVPKEEVDYYLRSPKTMFSLPQNLVPFMANTQGNRASTGARMITQALALDHPEPPLVQNRRDDYGTYEDLMGSFLSPEPTESGTVTKIDDNEILIQPDNKDKPVMKIGLYKDFPLNQDGYLTSTPLVKVGDHVKKDQVVSETNYTKGRTLSLGKNLSVAYMSYKGYNFEDGAVISQKGADKLSHTMIHKINIFFSPKLSVFDKKKFNAWYPDELTQDNFNKLDDTGIIKVGETVNPGEAVGAFLIEKELDDTERALKKLDKYTFANYMKNITEWDEEEPGVVTDVRRAGRNIDIYIKAKHPLKEGDKIAGRFGNKSIITKIIPTDEMPHRANGEPIDVLMSPEGVPGRMNIGQILETAAGKLAKHRGTPYIVNNFDDDMTDESKKIKNELTKAGLTPDEILIDGKSGKQIKVPIFVGNQYIMKLRHYVKKKQAMHSFGTYDVNEQPAGKGTQTIGILDTYSYLAHGAKRNLYEMAAIKGRKNEEYWRDLQFGLPPGKPERNFVFEKLITYLKGAGVNVEQAGHKMQIMPLLDKDVDKMSAGELTDPGAMLVGKNLASRKGGLFDPILTGGVKGTKWTHLTLTERIPNPMFEDAIMKALNLTEKSYTNIINGKEELHGKTGFVAVLNALKDIDVDTKLKNLKEELRKAPPTNVNKLNTQVRYMEALKTLKMSPFEAYTISKIPIIPPQFRTIYPLPSGDLMVSDINKHYRDVGLINQTFARIKDNLTEEDKLKATRSLYDAVKAMQGFIDPINYSKEKYKGFLGELQDIKGGLIHGVNWSKKQDLSGRSTITVEPNLELDEVGIPREMALTVMKPFIMRELKETGLKASEALKHYNDETPLALNALDQVMKNRPVIINRAPSLHKHSVQAFWPKITTGKAIKLNPLIVKGFNADFDGDTMSMMVPVSKEAVEEAKNMLPSKILFKHGDNSLVPELTKDYLYGLYELSKVNKVSNTPFKSIAEARKADLDWTEQFMLNGKPMTIGQYLINEPLPEELKDYTRSMNSKNTKALLVDIAKNKPSYFGDVISTWKDLGANYAYVHGHTISLNDFAVNKDYRDNLLKKEVPRINKLKGLERIKAYNDLTQKVEIAQIDELKKQNSNLHKMTDSGAFSKTDSIRQIISMPGIMTDINNNPIELPILKSFGEGLDTASYWNTLYGVRKGVVDRSVNTQESGALNKALLNVNRRLLITIDDCGTDKGLDFPIEDKNLLGRAALVSIAGVVKRNQIIDGSVILKAKAKNIVSMQVRSPLTCIAVDGICQMCYGLMPNGTLPAIGTNVGILDSQAITERATQLTMQTFHTGGSALGGGGITQGFPRLEQLVKVPEKLSGKAALSTIDGTVQEIKKNAIGGYTITVDTKKHNVAPGLLPKVTLGQKVMKGDLLSEGVIKPQELGELKTHLDAQKYLVTEGTKIYGPSWHKAFETVVRGISDNAVITDAPEDSGFYKGDSSTVSYLDHENRRRKKEGIDPIKFNSYFKSIDTINTDNEDWFTRITTNRVKDALRQGAAKGAWTNFRGKDPIPAYLYSDEFGKHMNPDKGEFY